MNKMIENVLDKLGWWFKEYKDDDYIEIGKQSPEGEDFFFTVDKKNIVREIREYADDFDPDEHAEMWCEARGRVAGVPQSIRALIDDADAIKLMLQELAEEAEKTERRKRR